MPKTIQLFNNSGGQLIFMIIPFPVINMPISKDFKDYFPLTTEWEKKCYCKFTLNKEEKSAEIKFSWSIWENLPFLATYIKGLINKINRKAKSNRKDIYNSYKEIQIKRCKKKTHKIRDVRICIFLLHS